MHSKNSIRRCQRLESMVPLAELTRRALINSDSCQFMNQVRYWPRAKRDDWLETLAKRVISLARDVPRDPRQTWVIWERLREQGYRLEDADVFVLVVRLGRAGYIPQQQLVA